MPSEAAVAMDVEGEAAPAPTPEELNALAAGDIAANVVLMEKAGSTKEERFVVRGLRNLPSIRRKLNETVLNKILSDCVSKGAAAVLKDFVSGTSKMDTGEESQDVFKDDGSIPEVRAYLHLLVTVYLIDAKKIDEALKCVTALLNSLKSQNRHTLQPLSAKTYFYLARVHELAGSLESLRGTLMALYRTACLRHDELGQAVILNALMRSFLANNLVDQADKLILKTTFPESVSNNETARFLYYKGRIRSIQLAYTEAHDLLTQAIRKAPENSAFGFKLTVLKLSTIVQLLNGDVPERLNFFTHPYQQPLAPYFSLTQAVRMGDLALFNKTMAEHEAGFKADGTLTLIKRLRHNVLKAGLRQICLSYARISLKDVAEKLCLENERDAEFMVAKAIRDGVIDAVVDHDGQSVRSKESADVYATSEPQEMFAARINFCIKLHNDAVQAMRFPDTKKPKVETAEERLAREKEEKELLEEALEEDDEADF